MSDTSNIRPIEGNKKTDEQLAAELLEEAAPHMRAITSILNRARQLGLELQIGWAVDPYGRYAVNANVVKPVGRL